MNLQINREVNLLKLKLHTTTTLTPAELATKAWFHRRFAQGSLYSLEVGCQAVYNYLTDWLTGKQTCPWSVEG